MAKMEFLHDGDFYGTLSASQGVYDGTVRVYSTNNNPSLSALGGTLPITMISATSPPTSGNYLRGDGVWSTPSGAGTIGGSVSNTQIAYGVGTNAIGGSAFLTYSSATGIVNATSYNSGNVNGLRVFYSGNTSTYGIAVGYQAGGVVSSGTDSSICIGHRAMYSQTNSGGNPRNYAIGHFCMYSLTNSASTLNLCIGESVARYVTSASFSYNTIVGQYAGISADGLSNTYVGYAAGYKTNANYNTAMGHSTLLSNVSGSTNTAVGYGAGYSINGGGSVFLGYQAGFNETLPNTLYIANSGSLTPLIKGDFSTSALTINGSTLITSGVTATSATISSFGTTSGTSLRYVVADYTGQISTSPGISRDSVEDMPHIPAGVIQDDIAKYWTLVEMGAGLETIQTICYLGNGIVLAGAGSGAGDGDVYRSTDYGLTWSKIEMGATLEYIFSMCYLGNGIVLAGSITTAADGGDVYRSTDYGLTWTKIELGSTLEYVPAVCYLGNGIALAGTGISTGDGDIYRSTDYGLTWTLVEMGAALEQMVTICYIGNGIVLAGAGSGTGEGDIYRSVDSGVTWSLVEMGAALEKIYAICYLGNGIVLAGAGSGTGEGDIYRSTDYGLTWSKIEMGSSIEIVYSICYIGNGIVLASTGYTPAGDGDIYRSTDYGLTWSMIEMGAGLEAIYTICYLGNGIILTGGGSTAGDGDIYRSVTSWNTESVNIRLVDSKVNFVTSAIGDVSAVAPLNGQTLVYSSATSKYIPSKGTSIDFGDFTDTMMPGLNWTSASIPSTTSAGTFYYPVYGNGTFLIPNYGYSTYLYSTDGVNWIEKSYGSTNTGVDGMIYANGMFLTLEYTNVNYLTSYDGITWTPRVYPYNNICGMCYGDGKFVGLQGNVTAASGIYSTDGVNWTITTMSEAANWIGVCYGNGIFVATAYAGSGQRLAYSSNGTTWTSATNPLSAGAMRSVCFGNGVFVAIAETGTTNRVMTSTDGINWTARTSPLLAWIQIVYENGSFIVIGKTGMMTSTDGITWTSKTIPSNTVQWRGITYGDGIFVAVSDDRKVMYSGRKKSTPNISNRFTNNTQTFTNGIVVRGSSVITSATIGGTAYPTSVGTDGQILKSAGTSAVWGNQITLTKTLFVETPTAAENITFFRTDVNITVREVNAVLIGSSTPSVTYGIKKGNSRGTGSAITTALPTGTVVTDVSTGTSATITSAACSANDWIWFETAAASGSVSAISLDIRYTED